MDDHNQSQQLNVEPESIIQDHLKNIQVSESFKKLIQEEEKKEIDKIQEDEIRAMLLAGISIGKIQEIVG